MRALLAMFSTLAFLAMLGLAGVAWALHHYSQGLPDYSQLADWQPAMMSRVYAGDGRLMGEYAAERRVFVPIGAIPRRVIHAFVSAEDQNFYSHPGVDPRAILRAAVTNIQNLAQGHRMIGASGITQQVAKNFLLNNEVSVTRKIREAILAMRMDKAFTKDRILELYLNEIFLGHRSYGVAAAALNYFNKPLDQLTVAECAYLAVLPKAPNNYDPVRQHDAALARRDYVIGRMQEDGYITASEAAEAKAEPLVPHRRDDTQLVSADYFAEEVRREMIAQYGEAQLYAGGLAIRASLDPASQTIATAALRHGLIAYDQRHGWRGPVTHLAGTADWIGQLAAVPMPPGGEGWALALVLDTGRDGATIGLADGGHGRIPLAELRWARSYIDDDSVGPEIRSPGDVLKPGDVVLVEPVEPDAPAAAPGKPAAPPSEKPPAAKGDPLFALRQIPAVNGAIVAMDPHTGRVLAMSGGFSARMSVFDRATQAWRQPGSGFKPFVYLAAMDNGLTPVSLVSNDGLCYNPGAGQPLWCPHNDDDKHGGIHTIRYGLEHSQNLITVRLAMRVGMDKVKANAEKFGLVDTLQPYLPMALGAGETTLLRLVSAYSMLDNGGKKITPTFIDRVQDRTGRTIFRHDDRPCAGCSDVAWQPGMAVPSVPDTREQIADPRTVYQVVNMMTGVVLRGTAAKVLASEPRPLAGKTGTTNDADEAWFTGMTPDLVVGVYVGFDQRRSLGSKEFGGTAAVPVFKEYIDTALADQPATPFRVPPGVQLVRADPVTGRLGGGKAAIWEAFLPGTIPDGPQPVLYGPGDQAGPGGGPGSAPADDAAPPTAASVGNGGLY